MTFGSVTIWKWVFKIAVQIIPILLGIDWSRPKRNEKLPPYKKRRYF